MTVDEAIKYVEETINGYEKILVPKYSRVSEFTKLEETLKAIQAFRLLVEIAKTWKTQNDKTKNE